MGEVTGEVHEEVTKQDLLTESLPEPLLIILSPPPPFLPLPGKPTMLWINWLKAFENYIDGLNEQELSDSSRCCLLQNCLGPEGQRVFTSLIQSETPYATAVSVLTGFFASDQTTQMLRLKFHQRNQAPGETVDQFVSALEELLKPCNYRDSHEKLILDQLIAKTNYLPLKERLLMERETLTLEGALVICKEVESAFNIGELFGVHEVSVDIDDFEPPVQAKPKRGRPRKGEIRAKPKPESQKIKTSPRPTVKDNYYTNDRLHYGSNEGSADNKKDTFEPPVQQKAKRGRPRKGEIRVSQNTNTQKSPIKRSTRTSRYKDGFYYMDDVPYDSDNEGENLNNVEQVTRIYEPPIQKKAKRGRPRKGEVRTNSKTQTSLTKTQTGPARYKENFYYTNDALYYSDNEEGSSSRADETNLPGDTLSNKADVEEEYVPHVPQKAKRGRPRKGESRANTKTQTDSNNSNTYGENVAGTSTSAEEVNGALEEHDPALSPTQRVVDEDLEQPSDDDEDDDDYVSSSSRLKGPFCPICENRRFRDAHKLARHMRTHTKEKPFVCPICATTFSQSYHMTRHMRNQHSAGPFICSTCGKSLETYDELTKHKTTHGRRVQTCPVCQENFTREGAFFTHLMSHTKEQSDPDGPTSWGIDEVNNRVIIPTCIRDNHENEDCSDNVTEVEGIDDSQDVEPDVTFKTETAATNEVEAVGKRRGRGPSKKTKQHICPHCPNRRFKGANKLSRHMRTHTKERPFVCPVCSLTFSQSYHMTRHLRNKHDLGQYICNKCGESVSTWMELKEHKKTHSIAGLTCLACDKQFQDKGALASHLKIHKKVSSPRSLSCSDCGKVFGRMYHLKRHIMSHRKASNSECYTCPDCHKTFVFPEDLNKHLEIHAKENSGTCPKCDQKFGSSEELETHMTVHDKIYPCSTCGKKFKVEYALRKHEQGHAHDRYYCSLCRKHFIKMSHYKRHILVHNRRESRCPHCGSIFLQLTAFKYHLRTHVEERPYQCSCCIETFEEKEELDQHCLKHRKFKRERPYSCTRCDNAFSSLIELTEHMTLHEGEQPQNCPICGKTFLNKNKLEKHLTIHTGERPHLCSICGNGFPSAASLKLHLHIHTGEKPFECSQCSKTFRSSSGLRLHSRQHMEVRPSYECPECGRTYGRMTELKMHQRYHTGDKPYACTCCSKRFISKDKLNVHMRIHTGERPYSCPHCGQTFTQTGDRNRHISKFH